ncbi:hypothetical protein [Flavobacterium koreense]
MTAISVFCTFTNKHNVEHLKFKNLENIYMISDSLLSLYDGEKYRDYQNQQKIFHDDNSSVVMGIAGMYNIGKKIVRRSLDDCAVNHAVLNATSLANKIDEIYKIVQINTSKFNQNNFTYNTTIVCNTSFENVFGSLKFFISAGTKTVQKVDCDIMEKIAVTTDGMDGKPFEKFIIDNIESLGSHLSPATKHFTLFLMYLNSNEPNCSAPPCQGIVLNKSGQIKELSIKHDDEKFYKRGKIHQDRAILKYEIDYRDSKFNFLSASKI